MPYYDVYNIVLENRNVFVRYAIRIVRAAIIYGLFRDSRRVKFVRTSPPSP